MNISDYFKLSKEDQLAIQEAYKNREWVKEEYERIQQIIKISNNRIFNLQETGCKHHAVEEKYKSEEDEFGRLISNSSYIEYYCPDCHKKWQVNV